MTEAAPAPKANMGQPAPRIDGRRKVTGEARYASDFPAGNPAYAFLVTSAISRGSIARLDTGEARAVSGVLDVMTHENLNAKLKKPKFFGEGGYASTTVRPLHSPRIWHDGQIVAIVLADTYEAAREAAYKVDVRYEAQEASSTFDSPGAETQAAAEVSKKHEDPKVGDAEAALRTAEVTVEAEYGTPTQHHNAIELFTTTCSWSGPRLTIHEPSQMVYGLKNGVADELGISADDVHVVSPFVGGAFGGKASVTPRTALIALAAKKLGRPVKLVATRDQGFTIATYRAETRHKVRLGASRDGKLVALTHEGWEVTSRSDAYMVAGTDSTARMYACPNVSTKVSIVRADRNTPGFMRSPPEVPYNFAFESALDELAVKLKMDPVELRRVNDTMKESIKGLPFTSRSMMQCFDEASAAFGWSKRTPEPGSMRDGDWLVGWGCAMTDYPTQMAPATARVRFTPDGSVRVETAAHDVGTGAYTVIGQIAAERLGVPLDKVDVRLGDSMLPPSPVAGGSITTASTCSVVAKACDQIIARLAQGGEPQVTGAVNGNARSPFSIKDGMIVGPNGQSETVKDAFKRTGAGAIEEYAEWTPHGSEPGAINKLYGGGAPIVGGSALKDRMQYAFGAEFVEVRIHSRTKEIRVPRVVGAFAAGRIMNPRTARSQLMGGLIWGIGSALHEATEIDERAARYINDNLADYLVPVNADIGEVEVILVPEVDDQVNPLGIKGLGELGNVGTAAAIANAVYHATGKRIRELPIRIEKLLEA